MFKHNILSKGEHLLTFALYMYMFVHERSDVCSKEICFVLHFIINHKKSEPL